MRSRREVFRAVAVSLAVLLAVPPGGLVAAPSSGTIQGVVRLQGRPLSGVTVAFIELESGAVVRAISGEDGTFEAKAPAGEYAVTTESQAGLTVEKAPVRVAVPDGKMATAEIELMAVPSAAPPATGALAAQEPQVPPPAEGQVPGAPVFVETMGAGAQIRFEAVTCFVAGEFPLLDAAIDPTESVARARVYFKPAAGEAFYYVEMTLEQGRFFGKLPKPRVEASPITYYLQSTTTEFEESQTREVEAVVVNDKAECGDLKVAAYGPEGPVTVFSAQTGAAVDALGFAAAGGAIAAGVLALIIAGAAAAGVVGGVIVPPGPEITPPPIILEPSPIVPPSIIPVPSATPVTATGP